MDEIKEIGKKAFEAIIAASGFEDSIEGLLGMRNLALLEKVSEWAGLGKPYIWGVNSKSKVGDMRALALGVNVNYGFVINADGHAIKVTDLSKKATWFSYVAHFIITFVLMLITILH